jgi:hypothetical protein
MSYIGAQPTTASFPFDQFSGNGSTTAFTLTYAPASTSSIIVAISGVVQNPNTYSCISTTLTFSGAPPSGTNNISVLYLGLPVIGVSSPGNTAYFSSTSFTATASQTTFTPSGSYQVGFINVIRNGSQLAPADYTATNGTTVVLNNACTAGDIVVIEVYTLTSISNALPLTGGTVTGATTFNAGVNLAVSSGNVGIGTSSPAYKLDVSGSVSASDLRSSNTYVYASSGNYCGFGFYSGISLATRQAVLETQTGTATVLKTDVATPLIFGTNGSERARIDTSGRLLVGTTSAPGQTGGVIVADDELFVYNIPTTASSANCHISSGEGNRFYRSTSALKYKQDIRDLEAIDIGKFRPVRYKSKCENDDQTKDHIGIIADEVAAEGIEELVTRGAGDEIEGFQYERLTVVLLKAVQEQQAMIEELKAKVAALEAK